jgi:hypothetical protein
VTTFRSAIITRHVWNASHFLGWKLGIADRVNNRCSARSLQSFKECRTFISSAGVGAATNEDIIVFLNSHHTSPYPELSAKNLCKNIFLLNVLATFGIEQFHFKMWDFIKIHILSRHRQWRVPCTIRSVLRRRNKVTSLCNNFLCVFPTTFCWIYWFRTTIDSMESFVQ